MSAEMTSESGNLSEAESDTSSLMGDSSSVDGGSSGIGGMGIVPGSMKPPSPASREQLAKRMESLLQENRVLKVSAALWFYLCGRSYQRRFCCSRCVLLNSLVFCTSILKNSFFRSNWRRTRFGCARCKRRIGHCGKRAFLS